MKFLCFNPPPPPPSAICWVRAASRPLSENLFHPLQIGSSVGTCQSPEMGRTVGKKLVLGCKSWETDFYTPPVLGGAALLPFSAPAVYKDPVP